MATVTPVPGAVVVRTDEPGLLREEETRARPVRRDDTRFRLVADDGTPPGVHSGSMSVAATNTLRLGTRVHRAVLTLHIIAGVGLLGDVAAVLAISVRAASTADPALAAAGYELLAMFTVLFGIPLSLISLATGVLLGRGTRWGVIRHAWVAGKLALLLGVILVGALVIGPGTSAMRSGAGGAEGRLIAGAGYDVVALSLATGLSVFKPRRRRARRPTANEAAAASAAARMKPSS